MQHFSCKTQIYTGPGCVKELSRLESKRLLLVTDPYFVKSGTAEQILRLSGAAQTKLFDKVQPDPSVSLAAEGTAVVREFQPDTVVALGGGSTMDCAKAMVYFAGDKVCLAAIPTTSGDRFCDIDPRRHKTSPGRSQTLPGCGVSGQRSTKRLAENIGGRYRV